MGKVFIFGMLGVIVIGLLAGGILVLTGSWRLANWRRKPKNTQGEQ